MMQIAIALVDEKLKKKFEKKCIDEGREKMKTLSRIVSEYIERELKWD